MNSSNVHEQIQQQFQPATTFNELLINEVRSHPQLYDQQHRVCTDNGERNAIWEVIASRIDESVNGEFAKKRWLQMRDRYRKELKMALRTSMQPKWPYFTKLAWLDPYLKDAKNIKTVVTADGTHQQSNALGALTDFGNNAHHQQIGTPFRGDFADQLRFSQLGNTVNFLESLMAASSTLLQQHQLKDQNSEFSPDSGGEASTSEVGSGGDGGTAERQPNHRLVPSALSNTLLGEIGTAQSITAYQQRSSTSPKDNPMENDEKEGPNNKGNDNGDQEEAVGAMDGHNSDQQRELCHTDLATDNDQLLLRRSASVSSPLGSAGAVDPSMEFGLNALFAQSSPLRLFGSTLLNATTTSTSVDSEHHQKHTQCQHRRALSAFTSASKQSVVMSPMRHRVAATTSIANGISHRNVTAGSSQPPYLVRRGFGVSKFRGRLATPFSLESPNSSRKFDIASMCFSPVAPTGGFGGRDKEIGVDPMTSEATANNDISNNNNYWSNSAMEWADSCDAIGNANATSEDEDALFARLVVARLKKFDTKERRAVRSRIFQWLDQKEEEMEMMTGK